jgi:hypothetical protein
LLGKIRDHGCHFKESDRKSCMITILKKSSQNSTFSKNLKVTHFGTNKRRRKAEK